MLGTEIGSVKLPSCNSCSLHSSDLWVFVILHLDGIFLVEIASFCLKLIERIDVGWTICILVSSVLLPVYLDDAWLLSLNGPLFVFAGPDC